MRCVMSAEHDPPSEERYDNPRRWWALGALVASALVLSFDITILNVALPTLAADLEASTTQQQWIVDAFLVVFAAAMLPAGLLGDRFGRRRMLIVGLTALLAGSAVGALVDSAEPLIAARAVMGLGAALVAPLALSVVPTLFGPGERAKAVAALGAALAAGMPLGPLVGGWLLDHYWWGSIFLVNVPMAAAGVLACVLLLPESKDPAAPRVDAISSVLAVAGLATLVFGVIEGPSRGWDDPLVIGTLIGSVPILAGLVLRERKRDHPMLDVGLLRNRGFAWNTVTVALVTMIMTGLLFVVPQYLQAVRGADAMTTGVQLMPMMGGLLVGTRIVVPLQRALGARAVIVAGLVVLAAAGIVGSTTEAGSGYGLTATWLTITGVGAGLALVPAMDTALEHLPSDRAGVGSGMLMTTRQLGSAIGVALLGSLLTQTYQNRLSVDGLPEAAADVVGHSVVAAHLVADEIGGTAGAGLVDSANSAFMDGMSLSLLVSAGAALVTALLAGLLLPSRPPERADEPSKEPSSESDGGGSDGATVSAPRDGEPGAAKSVGGAGLASGDSEREE
ncbi:MFS transporter [Streptomyces sp. PT12]|nr:MFS transporter [Streptomyces sp. PT12]